MFKYKPAPPKAKTTLVLAGSSMHFHSTRLPNMHIFSLWHFQRTYVKLIITEGLKILANHLRLSSVCTP